MAQERRRKPILRDPGRLHVAVCIDTRDGPGRERLLGVYEYAVQRNWSLLLIRQDDDDVAEQIDGMKVDGAILFDRSPRFHRALKDRGVFCVETSARNLNLDNAAIFVDDDAVGRVAAKYLASLHLVNFAYCGPSGSKVPSVRRGSSFCEAIRELGFPVETFAEFSSTGEMQPRPLLQWLRRLPKPIGILGFDDRITERLLVACHWEELRVPGDVALLGVGNDDLICELVEPKISSVCIPIREIGRLAAEAIDLHSQGREYVSQRSLPPTEIIARASTECLRTDDAAVLAAIELIRARAHRPFGTDQIIELIGIPRRTLERRFLAGTGLTIHDFIVEFRLGLAKRLLRRTCGTVSEVALQCGYTALSAFTRMFITHAGCHPDEYRKRMHQLD